MTTRYSLVRSKRSESEGTTVSIVKSEDFDFTDYRCLMTQEFKGNPPIDMEEWVHKDDLELYQKARRYFSGEKHGNEND